MFAYAGKIIRVNLTDQSVTTTDTEHYKEWVAGIGLATALFFDLARDKTVGAFDPGNVLVIAPGLFSGTLVPAACRTELVGIQAQSYPYEWFTRSNVGGRFANMMKYAGFDAIVIEGAAPKPTWINIVEGHVELRDATNLWGLDTYLTQKAIFKEVIGSTGFGSWLNTRGGRQTTQRPAVLAIGPAGENRSRIATITTDAGHSFGQGGFGGVWGAKNLKAISVWGTGSVAVADAKALMEARLWAQRYAADRGNPKKIRWLEPTSSHFGGHPNRNIVMFDKQRRTASCYGCHQNCRPRTSTGLGNDTVCMASTYYMSWDLAKHGRVTEISGQATNLAQQLGINTFELRGQLFYLKALYDKGILGPGKKIDTDLPIDKIGEAEFIADLMHKIAFRRGIGDDLAEGLVRAAERWGLAEADLKTGALETTTWGYPFHYDMRAEVYWGYASLLSGRDINYHDVNSFSHWMPSLDIPAGRPPTVTAEQVAGWIGEIAPYHDSKMLDFQTENMYSVHMARLVTWLFNYNAFWKQSCGLCDNAFADFVNPYGPNNRGLTPEGELKFYRAVTGADLSFEASLEAGRRIFNLIKAIWTLQGRHRDTEQFPEYMYTVDAKGLSYAKGRPLSYYLPTQEDGKWDFRSVVPRRFDRDKVEDWKTLFYELQGWDTKTGWQTRATLEALGLKNVADELEEKGKLP